MEDELMGLILATSGYYRIQDLFDSSSSSGN